LGGRPKLVGVRLRRSRVRGVRVLLVEDAKATAEILSVRDLPGLLGIGDRDPTTEVAFDCYEVNERSIHVAINAARNEETVSHTTSHGYTDVHKM
jgi:hypothetical protein